MTANYGQNGVRFELADASMAQLCSLWPTIGPSFGSFRDPHRLNHPLARRKGFRIALGPKVFFGLFPKRFDIGAAGRLRERGLTWCCPEAELFSLLAFQLQKSGP